MTGGRRRQGSEISVAGPARVTRLYLRVPVATVLPMGLLPVSPAGAGEHTAAPPLLPPGRRRRMKKTRSKNKQREREGGGRNRDGRAFQLLKGRG